MAEPFLTINAFTAEYGALSAGDALTAARLLQVASDHIRSLKADVDATAAAQVVFEVVRDAIKYGGWLEKFKSFQNITSRRQEAGTLDEAAKAIDGYLTERHRQLLGLFTRPKYYFGD